MSTIAPAAKIRVFTLPFYLRFVGIAAVTLAGLTYLAGGPENVLRHLIPAFAHPHLPDLDLIARAKPAIQLHLFAALIALGVGIWQIAGVKGGLQHRIVGWTWTVLMLTTAISALFIHETHPGGWSPIHLFSLLTLVTLPLAIYFVRTGKIAQHGRAMASLFLGGLILAGLITFAPGRLMWKLFFG